MDEPQFTVQLVPGGKFSARFIFEPLPQGYGHTLGNSLRRVLYSSIRGAAITSVLVKGASHQFTTLEGVREDVVQLVLNLKQVRLAYTGDKPVDITLSAKGAGQVRAGQFEVPASIRIANPDLPIANLADKNSKLELTATVESGFGYSPAEERKSTTLGLIPMDAIFSPLVRVNFSVEATRVGRVTNFDKLILEVETDGTITPQDAVTTASQTLMKYFQAIVSPKSDSSVPAVGSTGRSVGSGISVEELDLPTRISNSLQKAGFETVADLLAVPRSELAKVKNLGVKSVKIVEIAMKERGIDMPQ